MEFDTMITANCPYCGEVNNFNLEDCSKETHEERPMGEGILFEYDFKPFCKACDQRFRLHGQVSEYPQGCLEYRKQAVSKMDE